MKTPVKDEHHELIERLQFKKYFKAERWEDYNRQFFDGLAPKYDALNEVLSLGQHRRYKKDTVQSAGIRPGDNVLDLCTGSGDIPLLIAQRYPGVRVTGLDASENMLEIARRRAAKCAGVTFKEGDVLNLPFADNTFDVTIISFGLRNLADIERGIDEMKRVTRPGGRVVSLDLGRPSGAFLQWVHKIYFQTFIPFLGKHIFHRGEFNSFAYLPTSGRYFPPQQELVKIFAARGLKDVRRRDYMLGAISRQTGTV